MGKPEQINSEQHMILGMWRDQAIGEASLRILLRSKILFKNLLDSSTHEHMRALSLLKIKGQVALKKSASRGCFHWIHRGQSVQKILSSMSVKILILGDVEYPVILSSTQDAPPVLCVKGLLSSLHVPLIAIVGTRRLSPKGAHISNIITSEVLSEGFGVVSGGALGVDAIAHREALEQNKITILVCGTGIDRIYPPQHQSLFHEIEKNGAIVSQFPPNFHPRPGSFPRRNATISGLGQLTIIIEAHAKSGALHTAKAAHRHFRPVLVAVGSSFDPAYQGGNTLIRSGKAMPLLDRYDLLSALQGVQDQKGARDQKKYQQKKKILPRDLFQAAVKKEQVVKQTKLPLRSAVNKKPTVGDILFTTNPKVERSDFEKKLLIALRKGPLFRDEIFKEADTPKLSSALLFLELEGIIKRLGGGQYILA